MSSREEHLPLETLSAYVDGELGGDELALAEAHLGLCPACSGKAEDLRRLAAEVASDAVPPVPPDLAGRLARRLDAYESGTRAGDGESSGSGPSGRALRPWRWRGAPLAAAATILAAGLLWRFWLAEPGPVGPVLTVPQPAAEAPGGRQVADRPAAPAPSRAHEPAAPVPEGAFRERDLVGKGAPPPSPPVAASPEAESRKAESRETAVPDSAGMRQVAAGAATGDQVSAPLTAAARLEEPSLVLRQGQALIRLGESGRLAVSEGDYGCSLEPDRTGPSWRGLETRLRQDPDLRERAARDGAQVDPELRDLLLRLVRVDRRAELEEACGPLPPDLAGPME